jgi:hypothetical protein
LVAPAEIDIGQGRGRADGLVERALLADPRLRERVEEEDDCGVPLRVLLVDDQRAPAGGCSPVDPPRAVSGLVRP